MPRLIRYATSISTSTDGTNTPKISISPIIAGTGKRVERCARRAREGAHGRFHEGRRKQRKTQADERVQRLAQLARGGPRGFGWCLGVGEALRRNARDRHV